jgi:hypothetical protein
VNLGIQVKLPIIVIKDKNGAIFMAENPSSEVRKRNIDDPYHFICENVEDGFMITIFVRTNDNIANILTRHMNMEIYEKHTGKFLGKWLND